MVDIVLGLAGVRPIGLVEGAWAYVGRLLIGLGVGAAGGMAVSRLLKLPHAVPAELANLVALAGAWAVFGIAEAWQSESGIMAAVAMGLALQREAIPEERRLRPFKEQLTVLGISLLFVLLSANLPLDALRAEGVRGVLTVAALMLLVRPVSVAIALARSALARREKLFIAWIAPRGIVAASVASLFALSLTNAGFSEGRRVLAITFLTIAITVTLQGLTAAPLSRLLKLHSLAGHQAIIVGAGARGRGVADVLRGHGRPVVLIDRNNELVEQARALGFEAICGNALDETELEQAGAGDAETVVAATTNSEVNALVAHLARDAFGIRRSYPVLGHPSRGANPRILERFGGSMAFGYPLDVREWEYALEHGEARFVPRPVAADSTNAFIDPLYLPERVIAIARVRDGSIEIVNPEQAWAPGDVVIVLTRLSQDAVPRILGVETAAPV